MQLQHYNYNDLVADAHPSMSSVVNEHKQDFLSQGAIHGYYCNSKSREGKSVFFAVFANETMTLESILTPKFASSCFFSVNGCVYDADDQGLRFEFCGGLFSRSFSVYRDGSRVFRHEYRRDWRYELFHAHPNGSGYPDYEDFFSYVASHAVPVRRKQLAAARLAQ